MKKHDKQINTLVSNLITKSTKHNKELLNRFKICDIFSTLENKTSSDLQSYINESNIRFQKAKTGSNMTSLIKTTTQKLHPLSNNILSNHLYQDFDLNKEKAQLRHKLAHKEAKEINKIISNVKEYTTHYTTEEKKFREELNKNIKEKNITNSLHKTNTTLNTTTVTRKNDINHKQYPSNSILELNDIDIESQRKKIFKDYIYNDINNMNEQIEKYKQNVISISDKLNDANIEKKDKIKEIENISTPTTNHINQKLKFLTYTKPIIIQKPKKRLHEIYTEPIDIVKVFRFIKPTKYELARRRNLSKGNNSNFNSIYKTDRSIYSDTKQVVKNIAYKSFCFGDSMKEKRTTFDHKLDDNCLPNINEYECILKTKVNNNNKKLNEYKEKFCTCFTEEDTKRDILRHKLKDKMKRWNIPMKVLQGI